MNYESRPSAALTDFTTFQCDYIHWLHIQQISHASLELQIFAYRQLEPNAPTVTNLWITAVVNCCRKSSTPEWFFTLKYFTLSIPVCTAHSIPMFIPHLTLPALRTPCVEFSSVNSRDHKTSYWGQLEINRKNDKNLQVNLKL